MSCDRALAVTRRSEEHTSELQSRREIVCRLLLENKKKGDLSGGQKAFRDALTGLKLDTPTGPVTLDKNRNGIAYNFLTEVAKADDGHLYNKVVKVLENFF